MNTELYDSPWPFMFGGLVCIGLVVVGIAGVRIKSWLVEKRKDAPARSGPTPENRFEPIPVRRTGSGTDLPEAKPPKTSEVRRAQRQADDFEFIPPMADYLQVPHDPGFTRKEEDELLVLYGNRKQRKAAKARQLQRRLKRAETQPVPTPQDSQPQE